MFSFVIQKSLSPSYLLSKHFYLSVEVVVQVALLVLCTQHVHDFAVLWSARRAFRLAVSVAFKAVLVEGMAAQEVNRGQFQGAVAHVALGLLEYLGTW